MDRKLRILLTNDDGFSAPGIHHIYTALKDDFEVTVVAPEEEKSGIGHAFTYHKPLTFHEHSFQDVTGYKVAGTPADCVKFALSHLLAERPDIIVSGINNGTNAGIAGYYSGTVAAAREGAFWKITGIAFSLGEKTPEYMAEYALVAKTILQKIAAEKTLQRNGNKIYYNVNFPSCAHGECAGIKVTRQSLSFWDDRYTPVTNEKGTVEYWLNGVRKDVEARNEYDARAIENNFITITPLHIDATASDGLASLAYLEDIL